jgi:hypothetical protein
LIYLVVFLVIFIVIFSLVFYKYFIDTTQTIKALAVDRDTFRKNNWNLMKLIDKEREQHKSQMLQESSAAYINIKNKIKILQADIQDTDFNNFDNVKDELIAALKQIDSYGDSQ